jgi:hypothetical protein
MDQKLIDYKKLSDNMVALEATMEQVKKKRSKIAQEILERDGKGQYYDLGDGEKLFVSGTKAGTFFLAPRRKGPRKKKVVEATVEATSTVEPQAETQEQCCHVGVEGSAGPDGPVEAENVMEPPINTAATPAPVYEKGDVATERVMDPLEQALAEIEKPLQ